MKQLSKNQSTHTSAASMNLCRGLQPKDKKLFFEKRYCKKMSKKCIVETVEMTMWIKTSRIRSRHEEGDLDPRVKR